MSYLRSRARLSVALEDAGVVVIMRGIGTSDSMRLVGALQAGGIQAAEVTLNTVGAIETVKTLADEFGENMLIGAGTVIDSEGACAAIRAGAQFLVTPTLNPDVIKAANRHGKPVVCGVLTPTEAVTAYECGAELIKLFPAGPMGPDYLKQLISPLSQIPFMAVGGIDQTNAASFVKAGAICLGVGGALADKAAVARGDFDILAAKARDLVKIVSEAREC